MITHQLDIEVNGIETLIEVDYDMHFGQPENITLWDVSACDYIEHEDISDMAGLKHQLTEWAINVDQIYQDHAINN